MSENIAIRNLDNTLVATVTTEAYNAERAEAYAANQLSTDRHEDTGQRYTPPAGPMEARSTNWQSPQHALCGRP